MESDPKRIARKVRTAAEQTTEQEMEKFSFDNVIQSPMLADELQWMVGKRYIDDENGRLYEVARVWFSKTAQAVVGSRRPMSGGAYRYDDDCYYVYGPCGLLQLVTLYDVGKEDDVQWPKDEAEWKAVQMADDQIREWMDLAEGKVDGAEVRTGSVVKDMEEGGEGLLHMRQVIGERVIWQRIVPQVLREKCMQVFHEGQGHPGTQRTLNTMRLHYYWDGMRTEVTANVSS